VNPSSYANSLRALGSSLGALLSELFDERRERDGNVEFVRVRRGGSESSFGIGDGAELLDSSGTDLVVLLDRSHAGVLAIERRDCFESNSR